MKIGDIVIICLSFLLGLGIFMYFDTYSESYGRKNIVLKINQEVVQKIAMDESINKTYSFEFDHNIGQFEVENNKVRMLQMSREICKNQICSQTGWIDEPNELIVCLPNRIVLSIEGNNDENEVDAFSF
jgi:hypothetical protein